ncbi:Ribonuclease HI [Durusdinium trenchii]|uniref:Ribonuclease HI n=1 Tax=Durusdinium trenchii TaxID=1381693 RepID=A0ABP0J3I5_9DINO
MDCAERRQRGVRPKMPAYEETPLCSVGKVVRVTLPSGQLRRAMVECVDESEGTVEVAFLAAAKDNNEATLPVDCLRPLEMGELPFLEPIRSDFVEGAKTAKEVGNVVFKLGDVEAAAELYGRAIEALERAPVALNAWVLANRQGTLLPGNVVGVESSKADVELRTEGSLEVVRGIPQHALIGVQLEHLLLQGSLHLNRSRALAQIGQQQEAAQDLSIAIALWATHSASGGSIPAEGTEQLIKAIPSRLEAIAVGLEAHYLRAKTRISRQRPEPARGDLRRAWALGPSAATAALLRQAEREVDIMEKEKVRSNKKLAKEIAKLADVAMSGLDDDQLASFGRNPS